MKYNFITAGLLLAVACVRPLSPAMAQTITTTAGDGTAAIGSTGTGATNSIAVDVNGNMYVSTGAMNIIRKITPGNVVSTFAGTGAAGFSGDNGAATAATFNNIQDLFITNGNLYVADAGNRRIRKIVLATNQITTVAGNGTTATTGGGIGATAGVAVDGLGNIYVSGGGTQVIVKVTPANAYSIFAGTGTAGFSGDNAAASAATLNLPTDLYIAAGKLYIADTRNRRIRMVDLTTNTITTVAGDGTTAITGNGIGAAVGVVADGAGSIFVATGAAGNAVRKISGSTYTTITGGNATGAYAGDNSAGTGASLNLPVDLAMYGTNLLIADERNRRVRNLTLTTVPLSINLITFTATPIGREVLLQWLVAEKDMDRYDIERGSDAVHFQGMGSVKSRSNEVATEMQYAFTDAQPLSGHSFYRLKMTDRNGRVSYSAVADVRFGEAGQLTLSPVPASDKVTLTTPEHLAGSTAYITDLSGRLLQQLRINGNQQIDISSFAKGIYYLKLEGGTTLKFIKE